LQQRIFKRLLRELINSRSVKVMLIDMSDLPVSVKDQLARCVHISGIAGTITSYPPSSRGLKITVKL
jgi:hypothetical protein